MSKTGHIAVIPARGGSKRIPRKAIRDFLGQPILSRAIATAQAADCFAEIIVSTDDAEIAELAKSCGAAVPFLRPPHLADDYAPTAPVLAHAIQTCREQGMEVDQVACIYPASPFLLPEDIRAGCNLMTQGRFDFAVTVTEFEFPIQRAVRLNKDGGMGMFQPEHRLTRSQDLEPAWHDAGMLYWGTAEAWLEERPIFGTRSAAIPIPRYRSQDIDTPEDWHQAELMFRAWQDAGGG